MDALLTMFKPSAASATAVAVKRSPQRSTPCALTNILPPDLVYTYILPALLPAEWSRVARVSTAHRALTSHSARRYWYRMLFCTFPKPVLLETPQFFGAAAPDPPSAATATATAAVKAASPPDTKQSASTYATTTQPSAAWTYESYRARIAHRIHLILVSQRELLSRREPQQQQPRLQLPVAKSLLSTNRASAPWLVQTVASLTATATASALQPLQPHERTTLVLPVSTPAEDATNVHAWSTAHDWMATYRRAQHEFERQSHWIRTTQFSPPYDFLFKIVVVGNSGAGKTCFWRRWHYNEPPNDLAQSYVTMSVDFFVRTIWCNEWRCKLQCWDAPATQFRRPPVGAYYRNAKACFFLYDITDAESFLDVRDKWYPDLIKNSLDTKIVRVVVVGCKSDLVAKRGRGVDAAVIQGWVTSIGALWYETSAVAGGDTFDRAMFEVTSAILSRTSDAERLDTADCRSSGGSGGGDGTVVRSGAASTTPPPTATACTLM